MESISIEPIYINKKNGLKININCSLLKKMGCNNNCLDCIINYLVMESYSNINSINQIYLKSEKDISLSMEEIILLKNITQFIITQKKWFIMFFNITCNVKNHPCEYNLLLLKLKNEKVKNNYLDILDFVFKFENAENLIHYISLCNNCIRKKKKILTILKKQYLKSELYIYLKNRYGIEVFNREFVSKLLISIKLPSNSINQQKFSEDLFLLEKYMIHNNYYQIEIYSKQYDIEKYYFITPNLPENYINLLRNLKLLFENKIYNINIEDFISLEKKIEIFKEQFQILISTYHPELETSIVNQISFFSTLDFLNLKEIFGLLLDPKIEEIFLDSANDFIYMNHQDYKKCRTFIKLDTSNIESIKTHLRLESKKRLDEQNPSLIYEINNKFFNCRFSLDLYPSHWQNFALDIRKMNKNIFTLIDLIHLETLDYEMASFLIFCIIFRINITIVGEVDSGKTTLLNAIDLFCPKNFRRIYVEETIETLNFPIGGSHQLKYIVPPETHDNYNQKEQAIYKLLHRSGDLVILGEILSKMETKAMFHCLSAGLKGLQTTHASSISGLLNRWIIHYEIDKSCLNDLGIIVLLRKIGSKRVIFSINEIDYDPDIKKIEINKFWQYRPDKKWIKVEPLSKSKKLISLKEIIELNDNTIQNIINILSEYLAKESTESYSKFNQLMGIFPELQKKIPEIGGI